MEVKVLPFLLRQTIKALEVNEMKDELTLALANGDVVRFFHEQDCCEQVKIEEIIGDLNDLINWPLTIAEEVANEHMEGEVPQNPDDSWKWTFYKLGTIKGTVIIRWLGQSNGYYSESVEISINGEMV